MTMLVKAKDLSDIVITFNDGEIVTYRITAGLGIARHLAREAGMSGILTLWNGDQSYGIPVSGIRNWTLMPVWIEGDEVLDNNKVIDHET